MSAKRDQKDEIEVEAEVEVDEEEGDEDVEIDDPEEAEAELAAQSEDEDEDDDASLDQLLSQRAAGRRGSDDSDDDDDDIMALASEKEPRGTAEVPPSRVIPVKDREEFVCQNCYLVKARSQLADSDRMFCRDCA
jgi:hypothetical protein